ncbi:MAG: HAMP domain-containing protein [Desulfobacteraceae bacterium]|nr:HAMP domain-containing protein [Desulfobacteraceae bacterium]
MNPVVKRTIFFWYIASFLFPPGAWLFICWFSNLFSLDEVISIAASPLLGIYVIIYMTGAVLFLKKKLSIIEKYSESEASEKLAQKCIIQLPYIIIILQVVYSIIGPNTGLIGKEFIDSTEYMVGLFSGIQLIIGFTALFFIFFTISLEKWTYDIPIPSKGSLSFRSRLFIVSILSSTGIISMIILFAYTLVFKNPDIEALTILKKTSIIGVFGIGAILLSIIVFANQISRQLLRMKELASIISKGDVRSRLPVEERDEIGLVIESLNMIVFKIGSMIKNINFHTENLVSSSKDLSSISEKMSTGSKQTSEKSDSVAAASEQMSSNMNSISAAMEEATTNLNMVSSATEEMSSTINEIAQNSENARLITSDAVNKTEEASVQVNELGTSANEISMVVETITDISEQVNLLALNATIEAARAGEAGKGFAVVANEIKGLANQTAEASNDIKAKISGIQSSTEGTVNQISSISGIVGEINEIVSTIATAVEEQSVTTKEIAENVSQASLGVSEVNENVNQGSVTSGEVSKEIAQVTEASNEMNTSSSQVKTRAEELSDLAKILSEMMGKFKV